MKENMKKWYIIPACATCKGLCWGCWHADGCPIWEDFGVEPNYITVELTAEEAEELGRCARPVSEK